MFADVCVGGWESGVGDVVVFSMGTRLLTAGKDKRKKKTNSDFHQHLHLALSKDKMSTYQP